MNPTDHAEFQQRMERIEGLVQQLEQAADPVVREASRDMVRTLLDLHAAAMERMLESLEEAGPPGRQIRDTWLRDSLLESLLLLHDLHPQDIPTRVNRAIEKVRPHLQSESETGGLELLGVEGGTVRVQLESGGGAPPPRGRCGRRWSKPSRRRPPTPSPLRSSSRTPPRSAKPASCS